MQGPDLSLEANSPRRWRRTRSVTAPTWPASSPPGTRSRSTRRPAPRRRDAAKQLGVAPDAQLLALKLATTDGSTDVSQVIAALDWVVQHRNDNGMNVRVVNLSFGTGSLQPYQVDPLAAAAENAWRHGLVVVVSGGNDGPDAGG